MTRKDYILIASALRAALKNPEEGVIGAAERIAENLEAQNTRFNKEHFMSVVRGESKLTSRPPR